jgi:hypothetical protein
MNAGPGVASSRFLATYMHSKSPGKGASRAGKMFREDSNINHPYQHNNVPLDYLNTLYVARIIYNTVSRSPKTEKGGKYCVYISTNLREF